MARHSRAVAITDTRRTATEEPILLQSLFGPIRFQYKWSLVTFLLLSGFIEIPVLNANSADPDQTPRSVAPGRGLQCLLMSHLWDARLKCVKHLFSIFLPYLSIFYDSHLP